MAKKDEVTPGGNGHATREGWVRLQTDRAIYSAERGKGPPVQGILLGLLDMPPSATGKPWQAFVVKLTHGPLPVKRGKRPTTAQEGDEILIPVNHQLRQNLARFATDPRVGFEVCITPTGQVPTREGSVNTYDLDVNPQPVPRDASARLLARQSTTVGLLPAHDADGVIP
jgi:hypothetical protein